MKNRSHKSHTSIVTALPPSSEVKQWNMEKDGALLISM